MARDDIWRQIEALLRLQACEPSLDRNQEIRSLQIQMAAAEQEFERLRRFRPIIAAPDKCSQLRLH